MTVGDSNFKTIPFFTFTKKLQRYQKKINHSQLINHSKKAMKTVLTSSSVKSSTTTTMEDDRSESRDSCYFPGCRKDANCNCEICLASINATLDLMPFSVQKSSLTKLSAPKPNLRSPVSFNPSIMSTPRSSTRRILQSPSLRSTARLSLQEKTKERKKEWGFGFKFLRLVLGVSMVFAAEFGLSWVVSGVLRPELTTDMVRDIGEKCLVVQDLNGKLRFLQKELQGFVHGKVSNCSYIHSVWEMNQDGLLLHSRCTLFKSTTEEVSIWGWPLQTAGLLATGLSPRSFTILAGRVTEWSNGKVGYSIRKANSSWVHRKWSASAVQMDPNTWVLEYRRSSILENTRLFSAALDFLRFRMPRAVERMTQEFWLFYAYESQNSEFIRQDNSKIPT